MEIYVINKNIIFDTNRYIKGIVRFSLTDTLRNIIIQLKFFLAIFFFFGLKNIITIIIVLY